MILKGDVVRENCMHDLQTRVDALDIKPRLSIIVIGENKASAIYVRNKVAFAEKVGVEANVISLDEKITNEEVLKIIEEQNADDSVHGLFVQLPVPNHISENDITACIDPSKDVDGFTPVNIGKLMLNDETGLFPCTPEGIIEMIKYYGIEVAGKHAVIVGRSNIVGKPLAARLINLGATVTICNSRTPNIKELAHECDLFISAIGQAKFFGKEYFEHNPKLDIIDVGMNHDENGKLCGDINFDEVEPIVSGVSPVPGGVGVMTVVKVISNVVKVAETKSK